MTDFDLAFTFAMKWEGGAKITNIPGDRGGLTKYGISQNANPDLDIENLTEEQAKQIYAERYWIPGKCDKLRFPVNIAHFDACIQHGVVTASKFLQRAANVEDDGAIGPRTLDAVAMQKQESLCRSMIKERTRFYRLIVVNDATQSKFLQGWMGRIADLKKFLGITI